MRFRLEVWGDADGLQDQTDAAIAIHDLLSSLGLTVGVGDFFELRVGFPDRASDPATT